MLQVASNTDYEAETRDQALNLIGWIANYKPKLLTKNNLILPIVQVCMKMMVESDDEDDSDTATPYSVNK